MEGSASRDRLTRSCKLVQPFLTDSQSVSHIRQAPMSDNFAVFAGVFQELGKLTANALSTDRTAFSVILRNISSFSTAIINNIMTQSEELKLSVYR
jgi:hypothetical protein